MDRGEDTEVRTLEELARKLLPGSPWDGLSRLTWKDGATGARERVWLGCFHEVGDGASKLEGSTQVKVPEG